MVPRNEITPFVFTLKEIYNNKKNVYAVMVQNSTNLDLDI